MEAYTNATVSAGNRVELLLNGDQIFPAQLEAIRSARRTITYAQYFYEDGLPAVQHRGGDQRALPRRHSCPRAARRRSAA